MIFIDETDIYVYAISFHYLQQQIFYILHNEIHHIIRQNNIGHAIPFKLNKQRNCFFFFIQNSKWVSNTEDTFLCKTIDERKIQGQMLSTKRTHVLLPFYHLQISFQIAIMRWRQNLFRKKIKKKNENLSELFRKQ